MSKKIVVLTGSPRKNGNSFAMTDGFVNACEGKGYKVDRFDTAFMKIGGCVACDTCYKAGKACSHEDDFNKIAPIVEAADVIVFTCPVYWYTIPAQLKAAIDKFYCFFIGEKVSSMAGKKAALITCWEDVRTDAGDGVLFAYKKTVELMNWSSIGEVMISGVNKVGEIHQTDGIAQAIKLADSI